jgi:hypothetical protein
MLDIESILHIKNTAKTLFVDTQLTRGKTKEGLDIIINTNSELCRTVLGIIGDGGLIYLSTRETLDVLWDTLRDDVSSGISEWLIQSASTFRILAFINSKSYSNWIDHLALAYGAHAEGSACSTDLKKDVENSIAIDEDLGERLPKTDEWRVLLIANPWLVYLISLQLSYHEIYSDLVYRNSAEVLESLGLEGASK